MQRHGLTRLKDHFAQILGRRLHIVFEKQKIKSTNHETRCLVSLSAPTHFTSRSFTTNQNAVVADKGRRQDERCDEDALVISGVSGRFPQTESVEEFKDNLFNKKDMLEEQTRFTVGSRTPPRFGFLKNLDKFDAEFFGVSDQKANMYDPATRKLLEVTYEACVDAGINPDSLKGSQTGVFVAADLTDAYTYWTLKHGREELNGYPALGVLSCYQANYLSYMIDLKGPSMVVSTGCSGSLYAMKMAVNAIRNGDCDRAIVGAASVNWVPHFTHDLLILNAVSPTGECRPFEKSANGYVRAEAVVSMLIEKKSAAKRNYATIRGIGAASDGMKKEGIFFPLATSQESLYRRVYEEAGVDPGAIHYVETHGTGTAAGDPQEAMSISKFFAKAPSRTQPILFGSVKSVMGHSEAAAGLCGIVKVLIAAQHGFISPNINFNEPNENITQLFDGSMKVKLTREYSYMQL